MARGQHREYTELEILNRDHNWRQGRLRRLLLALDMLKIPSCQQAAKNAVEVEMRTAREEYEAIRDKIKASRK